MKSTLILSTLLLCLLFSCKKKNEDVVVPTKTEYLTKSGWKLSKVYRVFDNGQTPTQILYDFITTSNVDCIKDDVRYFTKQNIYYNDAGLNLCSANQVRIEGSTWSFANNERTINLGSTATYDLVNLNENILEYSVKESSSRVTFIYNH
jgi:hypothetical protein